MVDLTIITSEILRARGQAVADVSGFKVGCVIEDVFKRFFYGANSEFEDRTAGLCAESAAIAEMSSSVGATKIKTIYLCGAPDDNPEYNEPVFPCGICRQRLAEISDENTDFICLNLKGEIIYQCKFMEFFPKPFKVEAPAELIEFINTKRKPLALEKFATIDQKLCELKNRAFPLSGKSEACLIELGNGNFISGNYFGTSCHKADIDAKTAAYSKIARLNLWAEIKKVHFLG